MSAAQMSAAQMSAAQMSAAQMSAAQMSAAQMSVAQMSAAQMSAAQMSAAQMSVAQMSAAQMSAAQMSAAQMSAAQMSAAQMFAAQMSAAQMSANQLSARGYLHSLKITCVLQSRFIFRSCFVYRSQEEEDKKRAKREIIRYVRDKLKTEKPKKAKERMRKQIELIEANRKKQIEMIEANRKKQIELIETNRKKQIELIEANRKKQIEANRKEIEAQQAKHPAGHPPIPEINAHANGTDELWESDILLTLNQAKFAKFNWGNEYALVHGVGDKRAESSQKAANDEQVEQEHHQLATSDQNESQNDYHYGHNNQPPIGFQNQSGPAHTDQQHTIWPDQLLLQQSEQMILPSGSQHQTIDLPTAWTTGLQLGPTRTDQQRTIWPDQLLLQQSEQMILPSGSQHQPIDLPRAWTTGLQLGPARTDQQRTIWPDQLLLQQSEQMILPSGSQHQIIDLPTAQQRDLHLDQQIVFEQLYAQHQENRFMGLAGMSNSGINPHIQSHQQIEYPKAFPSMAQNAHHHSHAHLDAINAHIPPKFLGSSSANINPNEYSSDQSLRMKQINQQNLPTEHSLTWRSDNPFIFAAQRPAGQMKTPRPKPLLTLDVPPQTNAAGVQAQPGFYTRLLTIENLNKMPSLNAHGMPLPASPQSPSIMTKLESPPSIHNLSLLQKQMMMPTPTPSLPNRHASTMARQTESMISFGAPGPSAMKNQFSMPKNVFMLPTPSLLKIKEEAPEQPAGNQQNPENQGPSFKNDRKMKRPVAAESNATEFGQNDNKKMKSPMIDKRESDEASMLIYGEEELSRMINTSLVCLGIAPQVFDKASMNVLNFNEMFTVMGDQLQKVDANAVLENIEKSFISVVWIMQDIQLQAIRMFGRPLFKKEMPEHFAAEQHHRAQAAAEQHHRAQAAAEQHHRAQAAAEQHHRALAGTETQQTIKVENQPYLDNYAMMLFFFTRLYRKLAGLLETPFIGAQAFSSNQNVEKSARESLLIWLTIAREKFAAQFKDLIKRTDRNFKEKQQLLARYEKGDLDLSLISQFANSYNARMGAASTFVKFYEAAISQHFEANREQPIDPVKRNADIYLKTYLSAFSYLTPEAEVLAAENKAIFYSAWMTVKNFLIVAIKQLAEHSVFCVPPSPPLLCNLFDGKSGSSAGGGGTTLNVWPEGEGLAARHRRWFDLLPEDCCQPVGRSPAAVNSPAISIPTPLFPQHTLSTTQNSGRIHRPAPQGQYFGQALRHYFRFPPISIVLTSLLSNV
uniref:Uncharacterized protein n=1 Tax=Globodera rostochiensis TaxID=31243 RepID=A0A914HMM4_GLORO